MTVLDQISHLWSDLLGFISKLVIPDWSGLIALLPLFVLIGLVGPLLRLAVQGVRQGGGGRVPDGRRGRAGRKHQHYRQKHKATGSL